MTDSVDPGLSKVEDQFKELVWDAAVDAALAYLFGTAMKVPVIGWLIKIVAYALTDRLYGGLRLGVDLAVIFGRNAAFKRTFDNAMVTLAILERDKGLESEDYKNAKINAKKAMAEFVRFGSAPLPRS